MDTPPAVGGGGRKAVIGNRRFPLRISCIACSVRPSMLPLPRHDESILALTLFRNDVVVGQSCGLEWFSMVLGPLQRCFRHGEAREELNQLNSVKEKCSFLSNNYDISIILI